MARMANLSPSWVTSARTPRASRTVRPRSKMTVPFSIVPLSMAKGSSRMDRGGRAFRRGAPAAGGRMRISGESMTTDRILRLRRRET